MPELSIIERGLQWLSLATILALIVRLFLEKLYRVYPCFFAYLVFELTRSLVLLPLRSNRTIYGTIYLLSEPVLWMMYFMIVWELYKLVLRGHPGIATAGRYTLTAGILLALSISLASLSPDLSNPGGQFPVLHMVNVLSRAIVTTLVFFLLTITAFMVWFPVQLSRNTVFYCLGYSILFFFKGMSLLGRNVLGPEATLWASSVNLLAAALIMMVWVWKLRRNGEARQVAIGHGWRQQDAERLIQQLNSINDTLLRGVRR